MASDQVLIASPSPKTPRFQLKALPKASSLSSNALRQSSPLLGEDSGQKPGSARGWSEAAQGKNYDAKLTANGGNGYPNQGANFAADSSPLGSLSEKRPLVALPSSKNAAAQESSSPVGKVPRPDSGSRAPILGRNWEGNSSPLKGMHEVIAEADNEDDDSSAARAPAAQPVPHPPHKSPMPRAGSRGKFPVGDATSSSTQRANKVEGDEGRQSAETPPRNTGNVSVRSPTKGGRGSTGVSPGSGEIRRDDSVRSVGGRSPYNSTPGGRSPLSSNKGNLSPARAGMSVALSFDNGWLTVKGEAKALEMRAKGQSEDDFKHASEMCSAVVNNDEALLRQLVESERGVDCLDFDWRTALQVACAEGHLPMVELLIERGANVDSVDRWGFYPLKIAIREGHIPVRDRLKEAGATLQSDDLKQVSMQLQQMSSMGDLDAVKSLIENMASLHATDFDKRSPLHLACAEGHVAVVKFLIDSNAAVNATDRWGGVPLKDAIRGQHKEVQAVLRAAGAKSWVPETKGRRASLGQAVTALIKTKAVAKAMDQIHQIRERKKHSENLHYPEDVKKLILERMGTMSFISNLARALGRRTVYDPSNEVVNSDKPFPEGGIFAPLSVNLESMNLRSEALKIVATSSSMDTPSRRGGKGLDSPRPKLNFLSLDGSKKNGRVRGENGHTDPLVSPTSVGDSDKLESKSKGKDKNVGFEADGTTSPIKSENSGAHRSVDVASRTGKKAGGRMARFFGGTEDMKRRDSVPLEDQMQTMDIRQLAMNMEKKEEALVENDLYSKMIHWKFWDRLREVIKDSVSKSKGREDASAFQMIMTFATAFALWGSDLYILFGPPFGGSDHGFYVALFIAFLLFIVELCYNLIYKAGYFGSFYFYIDLISAFSLIPEVTLMFEYDLFASGDSTSDTIQKSGLAARAGFRTGRIVRVLRIFKLVRIFKILAIFSRSAKRMKEQTALGQLVHTQLQQKMVLLIVCLLLLVGVIDTLTDVDALWPLRSWTNELTGLGLLLTMSRGDIHAEPFRSAVVTFVVTANCEDPSNGAIARLRHDPNPKQVPGYSVIWADEKAWCYIREACLPGVGGHDGPVIHSSVESLGIGTGGDTAGCRLKFLRVSGFDMFGQGPSRLSWMPHLRVMGTQEALVVFDQGASETEGRLCPYQNITEARVAVAEELGMGTVTNPEDGKNGDPCSMAIIDILYASRAQSLLTVIHVCCLVCLLAYSDSSLNRMIILLVVEPIGQMVAMVQGLAENPMLKLKTAELPGASTETKMVAKALVQLSEMLQIAFGEAGSHIISHNITSVDKINALVPGKKVRAIFGFCDVRRFTDCTECFQAEVLVFMNRIADFAHVAVTENHGHATMNLGDAFQFAWLLHEGQYGMKGESASEQKAMVADCSLRAMLRVILETSCDAFLMKMSAHPELQKRMKGYVASSGFGLHSGWAIQGAIGSESKIDCIYLGSHVKWAERLESATKHYGVLILMTDSHYDLLSPRVQALCRRVDRIKVADNAAPIDLYTYDIQPFSLEHVDTHMGQGGRSGNASDFFTAFPPKMTRKWRKGFATALQNFLDGEWEAAQACLEECLAVHSEDGPSKAILKYMAKNDNEVPFDWKGYREVDDI